MTEYDRKCFRRFGWGCLCCFLGFCCYIAYGLWEPFLRDIYYPMPLRVDGSQFEFEYTPEWAILRRQTLALGIDAMGFYEHVKIKNFRVMLKLEIYQGGEKQYENIFLYSGCKGGISVKPEGFQEPIKMKSCVGDSLLETADAYDTSFFKFQPHKTYRIVVTNLENTNPQLSHIHIFVGLMGAYAFRTVNFKEFSL